LIDLSLGWSHVDDISPLASLTNLETVTLDGNQISDISPLASLTSLTRLYFDENQINDISPLASLTGLTELSLEHNEISDISPLVGNGALGEGDTVWLKDNNLDFSLGSQDLEDVRTLEARGVTVGR